MRQGGSDRLAGVGVPQPRRPIVAPGEDAVAVGTEARGVDAALVAAEDDRWPVRVIGVPEPRRPVLAPDEHRLAIGAERYRVDVALLRQGETERLAGGGVPEPRRPVEAPGEHGLAIGTEHHGGDRA